MLGGKTRGKRVSKSRVGKNARIAKNVSKSRTIGKRVSNLLWSDIVQAVGLYVERVIDLRFTLILTSNQVKTKTKSKKTSELKPQIRGVKPQKKNHTKHLAQFWKPNLEYQSSYR